MNLSTIFSHCHRANFDWNVRRIALVGGPEIQSTRYVRLRMIDQRNGIRRLFRNLNPGSKMAKTQNSKKQTKKAPQKTAKEKKQAKRDKRG